MAQFSGTFFSEALDMMTSLTITLPVERRAVGEGLPVLYLLHGLSDNHSCWLRRTNIDRYAEQTGIAVVMPEVQRSFYTDMVYGPQYFTYVADELPALCQSAFHVSGKREKNFVAGLSMGGYGALKVALSRPDKFAAAASFSGAVDIHCTSSLTQKEQYAMFGGEWREQDDLYRLADKLAESGGDAPRLYMTCGFSDFLFADNEAFYAHLRQRGLPVTYEKWEGTHNWDFWETSIRKALGFFGFPIGGGDAG